MITEETAAQIARRARKLNRINFCLGNIAGLASAELELAVNMRNRPGDREVKTFAISGAKAIELLEEMKAHEEASLDELNALAVQEAREAKQ